MKRSEFLDWLNEFYANYHDNEYYMFFCDDLLTSLEQKGMSPPEREIVIKREPPQLNYIDYERGWEDETQ